MRTLSLWATMAVVLAGCGGSQKELSPYAASLDKRVRSVEIVGNTALSDDDIIEGLATHGPEGLIFKDYAAYDPAATHTDAQRIETLYRQHGYFTAKVKDIQTIPGEDDFVKVRFLLSEGPPAKLTGVAFEWISLVNVTGDVPPGPEVREEVQESHLIETAALIEDGTYDHEAYILAKDALKELLVKHGYAHSEVTGTVAVDRDEHTVSVKYSLAPGPKVKYGPIEVTGNERVPDSIVRNRIEFETGGVYDPEEVETTRAQLYQLGLFSTVRIEMEREGNPEVPTMTVHVSEGQRHELRLGVGGAIDNSHFEVRGRAEYTHRAPLFDPKLTFRLELRPAYQWLRTDVGQSGPAGEARARVERLDLFFPLVVGSAQISYLTIDLESYSARGPRGQLGLARPFLANRVQAGLSWNIEQLSFSNVDPAIRQQPVLEEQLGLGEEQDYRLAFYEQTLAIDLRDQILDAHDGVYVLLALEEGTPLAGGLNDYIKADAEVRGYYAPVERLVLAARLRHARVLRGETDIPITRRYFSGGATSHRGFTQRRLTPVVKSAPDENGDVSTGYIGGDALVESSWEVRYDAFLIAENWLGFVVFADGGNVTRSPGRIEIGNLYWAVGPGLRYNTPVGPIRLDVAFRINRKGPDDLEPDQPWAFHISIGEAF